MPSDRHAHVLPHSTRRLALLTTVLLALVVPVVGVVTSAPLASATASLPMSPIGAADNPAQAGRDYATDVLNDPFDYSNPSDLLLDPGPTIAAVGSVMSGGVVSTHFATNGYLSPVWGGYSDPLKTGREASKAGQSLDAARYRTVAFQAWSSRDVQGGLIWFSCPNGAIAASCGGGKSILFKAGWHTYVINPGASVFAPSFPLAWGGTINGLRLSVSPGTAGSDFKLDWMRVVEPGTGAQVPWSNPHGSAGELVWDADASDTNNTASSTGYGVLAQTRATSGVADLSVLPPGTYRVGFRTLSGSPTWSSVTTTQPLPRFITPNEIGDKDYATTVLGNPWDMNGPDDVWRTYNLSGATFSGGRMSATNVNDDPNVYFNVGAGGIDTRIYHNLSITESYDGAFDLRNAPGGGSHGRWLWLTPDDRIGATAAVVTYSGLRTVTIDMSQPLSTLLAPRTAVLPFVSSTPVKYLRWDPNEDPGHRHWNIYDVQLRSDFMTAGSFPMTWTDAAYAPGGTATIVADTDRVGCNGTTVASGVPVQPGTNTTVWNTAGVPHGKYWLCLRIARGDAVTTAYAGGGLVVGTNPPTSNPTTPPPPPSGVPVARWEASTLGESRVASGASLRVSGWAFDPSAPGQTSRVDVIDFRPDRSAAATRVSTGIARADVARYYGANGSRSGFSADVGLPGAGTHTICVRAVNVGAGTDITVGCRSVVVPSSLGSESSPVARWESAVFSAGSLRVAGWAFDPSVPGAPTRVDVLDFRPDRSVAGTRVYTGISRPDVAHYYGPNGSRAGYAATVPLPGRGTHTVCERAVNLGYGTDVTVGCRSVVVP